MNFSADLESSSNLSISCFSSYSENQQDLVSLEIFEFNNSAQEISHNFDYKKRDFLKTEIGNNENKNYIFEKNNLDETIDNFTTYTNSKKNKHINKISNLINENFDFNYQTDDIEFSDLSKNYKMCEKNNKIQIPNFLGNKRINENNNVFSLTKLNENKKELYLSKRLPIKLDEDETNLNTFLKNLNYNNFSTIGIQTSRVNRPNQFSEEEFVEISEKKNNKIFLIDQKEIISESRTLITNQISSSFLNCSENVTSNIQQNQLQNIKYKRKFNNDSINKRIKSDCFRCLSNITNLYFLFKNINFIYDSNIFRNQKFNLTNIRKIIDDAFEENYSKFDEDIKNAERIKLEKKLRPHQELLKLTFGEFYEKVYLNSEELKIQLEKIKQKELPIYYDKYEFNVKNYLPFFENKKENQRSIENNKK